MKVLHVVASLTMEWGGPVAVIQGLTRALNEQGVDSTIFATAGRRVGTDPIPLDWCSTKMFPTTWPAMLWTGYAPSIRSGLRGAMDTHDVVHIHELWHYGGYAAYREARRAGRPYIVTVHGGLDPWALRHRGLKKRLYMALVQRRILQGAMAIHAVTEQEAFQIKAQGIDARISVIPNGINADEFAILPDKKAFLRQWPQLEGKLLILFLGRIHPKKGLDLLARAYAQIVSHRDDVALVIVGPDEGNYRASVESLLLAAGVSSKVFFTGMLGGHEKLCAYAAADIFVLPSYSEGFSMAVLEAMASGLPVVITPHCHFPEVADAGAGLIVEPEHGQLRDALARLLDEPGLRRQMGERGRRLVKERYTWDAVAAQMKRLYQEVAAGVLA